MLPKTHVLVHHMFDSIDKVFFSLMGFYGPEIKQGFNEDMDSVESIVDQLYSEILIKLTGRGLVF